MDSLAFLLVAVVACVAGDVYYSSPHSAASGYYQILPDGYYKVPPKGYNVPRQEYRADDRHVKDYYGGDLLRKNVHHAQESGLESARGVGGKHLVDVGTSGGNGYSGKAVAKGSSGYGALSDGGAQRFGQASNGAYGAAGAGNYRKAHSDNGFHKSYSNVESGKDSSYVDEDHHEGGEKYGKALGGGYGASGHNSWDSGRQGSGSEEAAAGHGLAQGGLKSVGQHQVSQGEAGRRGQFGRQRDYLASDLRAGNQDSEHSLAWHRPLYYL